MNTIRQSGFTLVSLPRTDIRPLSLLLKTSKGVVERLNSPIKTLFEPVNRQPPSISKDVDLPSSLSGVEKLDLKTEANLSFLQGLLKAFSAEATASFSLKNKDSVNFKLTDAKTNFVDIIKLDAFIQDAQINKDAKTILERLKNDDLYIVTETIKAKSFVLEEDAKSDLSAAIEAPIKNIVEVKTDVDVKKEKSHKIENANDAYCTIAIKAFQILYDRPSLFSSRPAGFRIREADDIKVFKGEEEYPGKVLEEEVIELPDAAL